MKENILMQKSVDFSVRAVAYYRWLSGEQHEYVLSKQFLRSATSIGANIHEANFGVSRADFIAKMQISLKETAETAYWLLILERTQLLPDSFADMRQACQEIKALLIATLNTAKANR